MSSKPPKIRITPDVKWDKATAEIWVEHVNGLDKRGLQNLRIILGEEDLNVDLLKNADKLINLRLSGKQVTLADAPPVGLGNPSRARNVSVEHKISAEVKGRAESPQTLPQGLQGAKAAAVLNQAKAELQRLEDEKAQAEIDHAVQGSKATSMLNQAKKLASPGSDFKQSNSDFKEQPIPDKQRPATHRSDDYKNKPKA